MSGTPRGDADGLSGERLVGRRVLAGFENHPTEVRAAYLHDLRVNWREAEAGTARRLFLLVVLAVVGGLLLADGVGAVDIFGVQLREVSVVLYALPVVMAYLVYEVAVGVAAIDLYGEAHDALFRMTYPELAEQSLGDLLSPANSVVWSSPGASWFEGFGRVFNFSNAPGIFWVGRAVAGVALPPIYLGIYFGHLVNARSDSLVFVSMGLTLAMLALAAMSTLAWVRKR